MLIISDDYVIFTAEDVITDALSSTTSLRIGSGHFRSISPLFPEANCHFTTMPLGLVLEAETSVSHDIPKHLNVDTQGAREGNQWYEVINR
ncbi:hypothetical protein L914_21525 [Phytophthora nicotianae]|uniref:Uncharacterized protein n=1 Tax=Phytophthora nicotianae TaxID=4792 RepID=W2M3E0_PHYNI|nr:hypothetical protein L916_21756 [Phytophthora nicotianae]ETM30800.1 hypothetical protein L914_21525 [Phytophthora nicotianae]